MDKVKDIVGRVCPLRMDDVDTDQIIPAQYLTSVSREGYGKNLFRRLKDADPNFPLNQVEYQGTRILLAGKNFGCGSSREHAVWALKGAGFMAVIAPSFADIFASNSAKNGLLLVVLPERAVAELFDLVKAAELTLAVRLESQTVELPGGRSFPFPYDPFRKYCLLSGLDDIDYIVSKRDRISEYRKKQVSFIDTTLC